MVEFHFDDGHTVELNPANACQLSSRPEGITCLSENDVQVIGYYSVGKYQERPACAKCRAKMLGENDKGWI